MAADRQLSRDFWLHEFSGWRGASEAEARQLGELVARVLQPIRTAFAVPVTPSSWLEWSDGRRREGAHGFGAVDFVVSGGRTREAWEWGQGSIIPAGFVGRWIYEPQRSASEGVAQGEHIHVAPRSAMVQLVGDDSIQVLEETTEGVYTLRTVATVAGLGAAALVAAAVFFFRCAAGVGRDIVKDGPAGALRSFFGFPFRTPRCGVSLRQGCVRSPRGREGIA